MIKPITPIARIFSLANSYREPDTHNQVIDWKELRKNRRPTWLAQRLAKTRTEKWMMEK